MIEIKNKADCCGCYACVNACPENCINMKMDNDGFLYPEINQDDCVNCKLCEQRCPILNPILEEQHNQKAYLIQNKNEVIRMESTSGGAFSAIAKYVIRNNGVAFGACFDENYEVKHMYAETEEDLKKFCNSKYVQSQIGDTFCKAKDFLKSDRMVCFSGTPCQIEGLKSYLGKDFDNLITVDVVCRAVPSPFLWKKYFDMKKNEMGNGIKKVMFRDKHYGYKYSTMTIYSEAKEYHSGVESDPWLRLFFSGICNRESCYQCKFKKRYRISDFTIWDCFSVDNFSKDMDDDKGTTRMIVQSEKGEKILDLIKDDLTCCSIDVEKAIYGVKEMFHPVASHPKREQFIEDMQSMNGEDLFNKYFPETLRVKVERFARHTCYKFGIYKQVKKVARKILKK